MAKNKIDDLRDHLFATLEALQDEEKPMEIERAKAVADIAQVIINSAKTEVDFLKVTGEVAASKFFQPPQLPPPGVPRLSDAGAGSHD